MSKLSIIKGSVIISTDPCTVILVDKDSLFVESQYIIDEYSDLKQYGFKIKEIKYNDFLELAEVREVKYYHRVNYFDNKGNKHLLNNNEFVDDVHYLVNLDYRDGNKDSIEYLNIKVDKLDIALDIAKNINRKVKNRLKKN